MNTKEGYIKFHCQWNQVDCTIPDSDFDELNRWRKRLYKQNLIGVYENGIGFGNISLRIGDTHEFYITGSATGQFPTLSKKHFARVTKYNFRENQIDCIGQVKASSESLTHAVVYESLSQINAVIHVHHFELWKKLLNKLPTTNPEIEYGTPEMAYEVQKVIKNSGSKMLVMGGHEEGILCFGEDLDEAGEVLLAFM